MHTRDICRRVVSIVCPSLGLSVCLSGWRIQSKTVNISSEFFHRQVATPFWFFHTKHYGNILTATLPPTGAKIAIFNQRLVLASITAALLHVVNILTMVYRL